MTRQWWFLFFLMVFADGPASILVWWRFWQWRKTGGLAGWIALAVALLAVAHGFRRLCQVIAWFQPLTGFNPWQTRWSWSGEVVASAALWFLAIVALWDYRRRNGNGKHAPLE